MRKKQQTTEHEDSHDHIISHHIMHLQPEEKNIIKLGLNVCVCVCVCVYIYIYIYTHTIITNKQAYTRNIFSLK